MRPMPPPSPARSRALSLSKEGTASPLYEKPPAPLGGGRFFYYPSPVCGLVPPPRAAGVGVFLGGACPPKNFIGKGSRPRGRDPLRLGRLRLQAHLWRQIKTLGGKSRGKTVRFFRSIGFSPQASPGAVSAPGVFFGACPPKNFIGKGSRPRGRDPLRLGRLCLQAHILGVRFFASLNFS